MMLEFDRLLARLVDNIDLADRMNNYLALLLFKLAQTDIGSSEFEATFASIQNFFEASITDAAELGMISEEQVIEHKKELKRSLLCIRQRMIEAKIQSQNKTK